MKRAELRGLSLSISLLIAVSVLPALSQAAQPVKPEPAKFEKKKQEPLITSPSVGADGKVTFSVFAPHARVVTLSGDFGGPPTALQKDAEGVWLATVSLKPGLWGYSFSIDGQKQMDPGNAWNKPSRVASTSAVLVPATPPAAFEYQGAAEGTVHLHTYNPKALGYQRRLRVYTPAGYEKGNTRYPVLYLLHGHSDNEASWTQFGHAHVIADNLMAAKQAVPAIIVMTDGHAVPMDRNRSLENLEKFQVDVLEAVIPFVDSHYRTKANANDRAIVGLSMGGEQALTLGMTHPETFAWVGGMSAATRRSEVFSKALDMPDVLNKKLRLLWIAIGKGDFLLEANHKFIEEITAKGIKHEYKETEGDHSWPVWRGYLIDILPRLFQKPAKLKA